MKFTSFLLAFALSLSFPLLAEDSATDEVAAKCQYPKQPEIPNGGSATEAELVAAQGSMKAYMAEGNDYIACITAEEESWGDAATEEQKAMVVLFNNKVVDDMQAVADLFNSAVRAYKGKN